MTAYSFVKLPYAFRITFHVSRFTSPLALCHVASIIEAGMIAVRCGMARWRSLGGIGLLMLALSGAGAWSGRAQTEPPANVPVLPRQAGLTETTALPHQMIVL